MESKQYTINNPMAPLWIKYTYIDCGSIGWRWGDGEAYKFEFFEWYNSLSEYEQKQYKELFPIPKMWDDIYGDEKNSYEEYIDPVLLYWNEDGKPEYCMDNLIDDYNKGIDHDYLFFWGHQPSKSGKITKSCLSQWWKCDFSYKDEDYNCAEQYMMAQKACLFGDMEVYDEIIKSSNPKEIKALGRKIKNFDEQIWDREKYDIVLKGNYFKFDQNKELRDYLLSTGDSIIVEASPYDGIWGIKMSADDEQVNNPLNWKGQNLLGFALMEVRNELNRIYKHYDCIGNL